MSISANKVYEDIQKIGSDINYLLRQTSGDCEIDEKIEYDDSADGRMYKNEIFNLLEKLEGVKHHLDYLARPIKKEGYLRKNSQGKYELDDDDYFSCGRGIEILVEDDCYDDYKETWYKTRIEHDGNDYYAVGQGNLKLDGVKARIR